MREKKALRYTVDLLEMFVEALKQRKTSGSISMASFCSSMSFWFLCSIFA